MRPPPDHQGRPGRVRKPRSPPANGDGVPNGREKLKPHSNILLLAPGERSGGRESMDSRLPSPSRVNRSGRAASRSGVMAGKLAISLSVSVRV